MTAPAHFKQADIKRAVVGAVQGARAVGLVNFAISRIEIAPDGKISIISESLAANDDGPASGWDNE